VSDLFAWLGCAAIAAVIAWLAYPAQTTGPARRMLLALRFAAVCALCAILFDVAIAPSRPQQALVGLDVSASWRQTGDSSAWRSAIDSAVAASNGAGTNVVLFGDSVRAGSNLARVVAGDDATRVGPVIERALAGSRPVVIVTDGVLDDADALARAPAGSRVILAAPRGARDIALADLDAPSEAQIGDTVLVSASVVARGPVAEASVIRWSIDGRALAESAVPSGGDGSELTLEARVVIPAGDSLGVLQAVVVSSGDAQPRNDTLRVMLRRGARQRVVVVSTAPDADVRGIAAVFRANAALPTDAYFRVAPGRWLRDGPLTAVDERQVRAAVRGATLAVLHGDTAALGAPTALGTRALMLLTPPPTDAVTAELLVRPPGASPLQLAQAGIAVDSLPPLFAVTPARGDIVGLAAAPAGRSTAPMPVLSLSDRDVRRVTVTASGFDRWRARGGVSAVAFQGVFGAAADWLLGARGRASVAHPADQVLRAGAPIVWKQGATPQSVVSLRRDGDAGVRTDTLLFARDGNALHQSLAAGIWRGTVDGQPIVLSVNQSREWVPRAPTVRTGPLNGPAVSERRGARRLSWLYLATVGLFIVEWLLRRRAGLR
jgi:hypothetical protein